MIGAVAGAAGDPAPGRPAPERSPVREAAGSRLSGLRRDGLCLAALAAAFALSVVLVGPEGEFPLDDDWSFVRSVRALLAAHDWRPLGWAGMAQISHALFGAAVCSLVSCSFEHLRVAVLLAALALALSSFALCRWAGASRLAAALGAGSVVLNPVLHPLAFTFMTDVPFALMTVGGAAAGVRMLRGGRRRDVVLASALVVLATLSRQPGAAVGAGLLPAYLLASRERWGVRLAKAALPLAASLSALLAYEHWMRRSGRLPALYDQGYASVAAAFASPLNLAGIVATNLVLCGLYLGLACLPVLILCPVPRPVPLRAPRGPTRTDDSSVWSSRPTSMEPVHRVGPNRWCTIRWVRCTRARQAAIEAKLQRRPVNRLTLFKLACISNSLTHAGRWAAVAVMLALLVMVRERSIMPLLGNVFGKAGVGPLTLRDVYVLGLPNVPDLPAWFWLAVTASGLLGLGLLTFRVLDLSIAAWRRAGAGTPDPASVSRLFGLAATAAYLLMLSPGAVFDRYAVAIAPVLLLGIAPTPGEAARAGSRRALLASGYAAALAVVATLATHDGMAWNRARWAAIAGVERSGEADAATMDGGFEYDGYRAYDPLYAPRPGKSWWWVADDRIQIAFGPVPGTEVLRRFPYRTWLPPDTRAILVLRRATP